MTDPNVVPEVTVVVHPIDTEVHPTWPPGWRWQVMLGRGPLSDYGRLVGALIHSDEGEANIIGEQAGAAVTKALRMLGIPAKYGYLRLGYDPLPADADEHPIGVWRDGNEQPGTTSTLGA